MSVVISGLGFVGASGAGHTAAAEALANGHIVQHDVDRSAGYHRPGSSRKAALVQNVDLSRWLSPRKARRMSPPSKLAVAAARMAIEDAAFPEGEDREQTAVVVSTAYGPSSFTEEILLQILGQSPSAVSPFLFTESVANAAAAQVALQCGAAGPNLTITQREAGPLLAVGRAVDLLESGEAARVLVLTVDELPPLLHAILDRFAALTREAVDGLELPRPFDRQRKGGFAAEGSTALLLELEDAVRERGARVLARPLATIRAFDPKAGIAGWSRDGASVAESLRLGAQRSGLALSEVDRVVSGTSGIPGSDRLDGLVLRDLWPEVKKRPPILVPKATLGDHGGALLVGALLAARNAPFAATPGFRAPDPELEIVPHDGSPLENPRCILVSALAAGGCCTWSLLQPGDTDGDRT